MSRVINCICGKPMFDDEHQCSDCRSMDYVADLEESLRNLLKENGALKSQIEHYKQQISPEVFESYTESIKPDWSEIGTKIVNFMKDKK